MSYPPACRLPPELINYVVKFYTSDKATLSSIRLVCKAWAPFAQLSLFDRLRVYPTEFLNRPCEEILAQSDSTLLDCIRQIKFDSLCHEDNTLKNPEFEYYQNIVSRLKDKGSIDIRSLVLRFIQYPFPETEGSFLTFLSSSFPNIVELNLWVHYSHVGDFIRFMCSFPRLENLGVDLHGWVEKPGSSQSPAPTTRCTPNLPKSLKRFHCAHPVEEDAMAYFNAWLSLHPPRPVSEISVLWTRNLNMQSYVTMCSEVKTLYLNLCAETNNRQDCDLSRLQVLEILTLKVNCYRDFPRIRVMLDTLQSTQLCRIEFILERGSRIPWLDADWWKKLDPLLAADKFKGVAVEMHVVLPWHITRKEAEEQAGAALRSCHTQGRLSVVPLLEKKALQSWTLVERWR
ncbi:hypothetical protein L218DRAFT_492991 [Marasmius fiardii PR-910]|nr:hypothetical protein L218DRAFT_492991 [Marasmius fiardii PR-910]